MKKYVILGVVVLLIALLVFLVVFLFRGMGELNELVEQGKDLNNKNEQNTNTPDDTTQDPPESDPTDPPEEVDPFDAEDTSNAASQSAFYAKVGSKDGMTAGVITGEDIGQVEFLHDGLTVYENGTMVFNDTSPGFYYEVGTFEGEMAVMPHRLYYRLFKDGAWENSVHVVDGTNFVLYLSFSYDSGSGWNSYQRYDGSFSLPDRHYIGMVAIGLAEDFTPDFEGFRLYVLED